MYLMTCIAYMLMARPLFCQSAGSSGPALLSVGTWLWPTVLWLHHEVTKDCSTLESVSIATLCNDLANGVHAYVE